MPQSDAEGIASSPPSICGLTIGSPSTAMNSPDFALSIGLRQGSGELRLSHIDDCRGHRATEVHSDSEGSANLVNAPAVLNRTEARCLQRYDLCGLGPTNGKSGSRISYALISHDRDCARTTHFSECAQVAIVHRLLDAAHVQGLEAAAEFDRVGR